MFKYCKKQFWIVGVLGALSPLLAFDNGTLPVNFIWVEQCLKTCFDSSAGGGLKLKKWDVQLTDKGFFRLRKYYPNGKQEYFSFNITRFKDLDYLGTTEAGELIFHTFKDDIIVQTYNDPKGNIDSMAERLRIPVMNIEPEMLDSLRSTLSLKAQ